MKYPTRVKDSTTTTGTGNITCANTPPLTYRALGAEVDPGDTFPYGLFHATLNEWEIGTGTMLTETTFSRAPSSSSNGDALVNFSAGTKDLLCVLGGSALANVERTTQVPFATAIPLNTPGHAYMADKTVNGALTFTAAAGAVRGALVYLRMIADGANLPNFSAFKEWGGSSGYDNRNGIVNQVQFFYDGVDLFYSASQAVGAVPVAPAATAVTMSGPTGGVVNTASSVFTVGTNGTRAGAVVVTPTPVTGVTFNPSSVTLLAGTSTATFTATPTTTGAKTIAITNNGSLTNPASITYTATAAATVPAAPTIGTAAAGDGYIDVAFTRNSDGGSAVIDSTATLSTGQTATGTTSPIRVTAPNGTAATATVKDRNAVGSSAASAASNSVTPAAAGGGFPRLTNLTNITESGTGPYSYAGTDKAFSDTFGGLSSTGLPASGDGWLSFVVGNYSTALEPMLGITTGNTVVAFGSLPCAFYPSGQAGSYMYLTNGSGGASSSGLTPANGDIMRMRRSGTSIIAEVSKNGGTSYTMIYTWTGQTTAALRFEVIPAYASQANTLAASGLV